MLGSLVYAHVSLETYFNESIELCSSFIQLITSSQNT